MVMQMIVNIFFFVSCLCIESVFRLTIYRRKDNFFMEKFRILPKNSNRFGFIALTFHYLFQKKGCGSAYPKNENFVFFLSLRSPFTIFVTRR